MNTKTEPALTEHTAHREANHHMSEHIAPDQPGNYENKVQDSNRERQGPDVDHITVF